MNRKEILSMNKMSCVQIVVAGPVSSGKSVILDRIEKVIKEEFGAYVISKDLEKERNLRNFDVIDSSEKATILNTVFVLKETVLG